MPFDEYRARRDFGRTPEPSGALRRLPAAAEHAPRFVVQEHHARRLHWDLRLEHLGAAVSFALPSGIPAVPAENRRAVRTEDHPLEYLTWEGEIPAGEYGAGTVRIWDGGTYEPLKWTGDKIDVAFHGDRLSGRYGLFPLRARSDEGGEDWMIHRIDPPPPGWTAIPEQVRPMLARRGTMPADSSDWSFEVKWDGVRALAFCGPGRLRLSSRVGNDITATYPELRGLLAQTGMDDILLDGEIVAFDDQARPSFELLQRRIHVTDARAVTRLRATVPVVYAIFDVLHIGGESLLDTPYAQRRERLLGRGLAGPHWRVPEATAGAGAALLDATRQQGIEGVVAKRLRSRYTPGVRGESWIKLKHSCRQELVICGWLPGAGRRAGGVGALLTGYHDAGELVYAGRVGTGFTDRMLDELATLLAPLRQPVSPFDRAPKLPGTAVFVAPRLVAEIEFAEWTRDGVMRAPSFRGLRDDKPARDVVREGEGRLVVRDGTVQFAGRRLRLSNTAKVLFPEAGFTKGDLIAYYARISPVALPHLRGRALTLKRYPNGSGAPHFYEKNAPSHRPAWVPTARVGEVDYTLCEEPATLVWLANLADVELHTSLSLASYPDRPAVLAFDLDPGPPADIVQCCEVARVLAGMFDALGLRAVVKTSGSKGMQVYVPLGGEDVTYAQTKPFARRIAELLQERLPELVVARMTKRLRPGRVLVDWSQNDAHKTTVTAYSVRALAHPGVSTPLSWEEVDRCATERRPELLTFTPAQVLERVAERGDLFAGAAALRQDLPSV